MDKDATNYWNSPEWKIPGTQWEITGYSRACYRTGFYIKSLDLMIDAGPQRSPSPKTILITHCHGDHIASIPFTLIGKNEEQGLPNIFVPEKVQKHLNDYILSMFSANYGQTVNYELVKWWPVKDNKSESFRNYRAGSSRSINITIDTFPCYHDVPTVCYGISSISKILKKEYEYLKGNNKELGLLVKSGNIITEEITEPKIIFIWDTTIEIFTEKRILNYPIIMIECTFLYADDLEQSKKKKHIHWLDLRPFVINNPDILFVLVHFSLRYKIQEIIDFFNKEKITKNINNVKPWVYLSD